MMGWWHPGGCNPSSCGTCVHWSGIAVYDADVANCQYLTVKWSEVNQVYMVQPVYGIWHLMSPMITVHSASMLITYAFSHFSTWEHCQKSFYKLSTLPKLCSFSRSLKSEIISIWHDTVAKPECTSIVGFALRINAFLCQNVPCTHLPLHAKQ